MTSWVIGMAVVTGVILMCLWPRGAQTAWITASARLRRRPTVKRGEETLPLDARYQLEAAFTYIERAQHLDVQAPTQARQYRAAADRMVTHLVDKHGRAAEQAWAAMTGPPTTRADL
ncbi:hypothetical protein [Deinococcus soli (ex Cha et al. 2016)]|uniref:hypothetical protein n=1 Tax=Deinococcus soli (ex Cha et al. 2016) TaxID=1309411 RepID=UPI0016652B8F|nr:hypothetical protein [Deinococcus soli (ex Cha et al. 2016)]GGB79432.1 hypothetical protein GCM10008019_39570 [Deinococcus soli (ex Cha et al. 2016)]